MSDCRPSDTPIDTSAKLSNTAGSPLSTTDASEYRSLVGALQYLIMTRPDIQYAIQQACLHMHAPTMAHQGLVKQLLRYIRGTTGLGLHLRRSPEADLVAYSDADWAGCPDTRRSTSGYCVFMGDSLISWSSKRQTTVSQSSAKPNTGPSPKLLPNAHGSGSCSGNWTAHSPRQRWSSATMSLHAT